jgi:hypothetical protein
MSAPDSHVIVDARPQTVSIDPRRSAVIVVDNEEDELYR